MANDKNHNDSIDQFLKKLEEDFKADERTYKEKSSEVSALETDYTRKKSYFDKIEVHWDKIQDIDELGIEVKEILLNIQGILGSEGENNGSGLAKKLKDNEGKMEGLFHYMKKITEEIEAIYRCCVEALNKEIDTINNPEFDSSGGIVGVLDELETAYKAALDQAVVVLKDALNTYQWAIMLRQMVSKEIPEDTPCVKAEDASTYHSSETMDRKIDELKREKKSLTDEEKSDPYKHCEEIKQKNLIGIVAEIIEKVEGYFPLSSDSSNNTTTQKKDLSKAAKGYYKILKVEHDLAELEKDCSFEKLAAARKARDEAKTERDARKGSLEAAKAAKKC